MACELYSGPAWVGIYDQDGVAGSTATLLAEAECCKQLEPLTITGNSTYISLQNQCSQTPQDYKHSGKQFGFQASIADFSDPNFLALCFDATVLRDVNDPTKYRVDVRHDSGKSARKVQGIIKPYEGSTVTTDENLWFTMKNLCLMSETGFNATFDVNSQRSYSVGFQALPDDADVIVTMGYTAISV